MARESLKSATDGHIELTKTTGSSSNSSHGQPSTGSSEKHGAVALGDAVKSGFRTTATVIEYGRDFTCRKSMDIPFASFRK